MRAVLIWLSNEDKEDDVKEDDEKKDDDKKDYIKEDDWLRKRKVSTCPIAVVLGQGTD